MYSMSSILQVINSTHIYCIPTLYLLVSALAMGAPPIASCGWPYTMLTNSGGEIVILIRVRMDITHRLTWVVIISPGINTCLPLYGCIHIYICSKTYLIADLHRSTNSLYQSLYLDPKQSSIQEIHPYKKYHCNNIATS